jgi:hypothetical protein
LEGHKLISSSRSSSPPLTTFPKAEISNERSQHRARVEKNNFKTFTRPNADSPEDFFFLQAG